MQYDVTNVGLPGGNINLIFKMIIYSRQTQYNFLAGGGEYDVQLGFGWTNGVILDFLNEYGDRLSYESLRIENPQNSA